MAATPKGAIFEFRDTKGATKSVSGYVSDVAAAFVTLDQATTASASSLNFISFPFPVYLTGYRQITGTADTTQLQVLVNGVPTGDILNYVVHVSTNSLPPQFRILVPAGARLQFKQLA